jgi:hypothetical protein
VEGFYYGRRDKFLVLLHQVEIYGFTRGSQGSESFECGMAASALERYKSVRTSQAIVELLSVCLIVSCNNLQHKKRKVRGSSR